MNPILIRTCSTKVLTARRQITPILSRRFQSFSFRISGRLKNESLRNRDRMLITQAITVPITVAIAAPRMPSAGKPQ